MESSTKTGAMAINTALDPRRPRDSAICALPNVPTTVEAGFPDSSFEFYIGLTVPKKTPRDIVALIHRETLKGVEDPSVQDKFVKLGVEPLTMTPEAFDARIAKEAPLAVQLAKAAGIGVKQ